MAGKRAGKRSGGGAVISLGGQGFGAPASFRQILHKVDRLREQGQFPEANRYLQDLTQRYPHQLDLLELHLAVAVEREDERTCTRVAARLLELSPLHADALYIMTAAAAQRRFLVLALHLGQSALATQTNHSLTEQIRKIVEFSAPLLDEVVAEMDLPRAKAIEAMMLHEWAQFHLEWGEFDQVETLEQKVLAIAPQFWSAYNNLSLAAFMRQDLPKAIDWAEQVLAGQPDNIHALSNLVRYSLLVGKADSAQDYGLRLKQSQASSWDPVTKKLEALSYLNDMAGILAVWEEAEADENSPQWSGMLLHWVAVAKARNGQAKEADRLWLKALRRSPDLEIAQQNREEAKKPLGQRHDPWAFDLSYWLPPDLDAALKLTMNTVLQNGRPSVEKLRKAFSKLHDNYPSLGTSLELLLDRGDPMGRETAVSIAMTLQRPPFLDILHRFVHGQNGPDGLRQKAAQLLVEVDYLESEKVRMWLKGTWQEVQLMSYELHDEPLYDHSRSVLTQLEKVLSLLQTQEVEKARQAETLLQELLAIRSAPDLLNNLAASYQIQGRDEEAIALSQQLVADDPKYIPARLTLAQYHLSADEVDAAEALLLPILNIRRMHYKNFALFSQLYLRLHVAKEEPEKAQGWLELWEHLMPDHPLQEGWVEQLDSLIALQKMQKFLEDKPPRMGKGTREKTAR